MTKREFGLFPSMIQRVTLLAIALAGGLQAAGPAALPLSFEENRGQADPRIRFLARGSGYTLLLTAEETVLRLERNPPFPSRDSGAARGRKALATSGQDEPVFVRTKLVGGNVNPKITATDRLPGDSNYFIGNDSTNWLTGIPNYARVRQADVYPGIDLVHYGNQGQLEFDFVVAPGGDPAAIQIAYEGVEEIAAGSNGELILRTRLGTLHQRSPVLYQERDGQRERIEGRYLILGSRSAGFHVGAYDRSRPLVIDPILSYSTFFGGGGVEVATDMALDSSGNAFLVGTTSSTDLLTTTGAHRGSGAGRLDMFVTKINSSGTAVVYSTYLGGSADDYSTAIAVDRAGNAYVTGHGISVNYPTTTGAYQVSTPDVCCEDAVVTKLNASGSGLVYSTYLAGLNHDIPDDIAVDFNGTAYVIGSTKSLSFPDAPAVQPSNKGDYDGFVVKVNPSGSALESYTFLGGTGDDEAVAIALDGAGNLYLAGYTRSANFPMTPSAIQPAGGGDQDAFIAKLTPGLALSYSSYLGGSGDDAAWGVALSPTGVYVTGRTASANFRVTTNGYQRANKGGNDAFLTKFSSDLASVLTSTYLGGRGDDRSYTVAVDGFDNVYLAGRSDSADFPLTADALKASPSGTYDMFVAKLGSSGTALAYSTLFGGNGLDDAFSSALDSQGRFYVAGQTSSTTFTATSGAPQPFIGGPLDAILVRFEIPNVPQAPSSPSSIVLISGNNQSGAPSATLAAPLVVEVRTVAGTPVADVLVTFAVANASVNPSSVRTDSAGRASTRVTLGATAGSAVITASVAGLAPITFTASVIVVALPPSIAEVVDGAAFLPSISAGAWVTIRGSNLASSTRIWGSSDFAADAMPTTLDGVRVTINGRAAAIYYISPAQLNVLAPSVSTAGQVTVVVTTRQGTASNTGTMRAAAPTFFMLDPENRKYVAAVNPDGTLVGKPGLFPSSPSATRALAARGRAMIFGTGWGVTTPAQPDGLVFSDARPLLNASSVRITIGGAQATIEFAGAVSPGLYQFNVIAPDLPAGDHAIVGEIDGVRTQPGAFITIAAAPAASISSITPSSAQAGQAFEANITGQNLANISRLVFTPSAGITAAILAVSDTSIRARIEIATAAAAGQRTLSVGDGVRTSNSLPFTITALPPPSISSVTPASGQVGQVIETMIISGQSLGGVTSLVFSPSTGLNVSILDVTDTSVRARVEIAGSAAAGQRTLSLRDGARTSNSLPFTITALPPLSISSVTPVSGQAGQVIEALTITGQNLGSVSRLVISPATGLTVSILDVTDTSVSARLEIASTAAAGARSLSVGDGTRTSNTLTFTITPPPPVLTSISPTSAEVSEFLIEGLTVSGQNLGSSPQISFEPSEGILVIGRRATGALVLRIANDATPGERQVTVTTSGVRSNSLPFTIRPRSGNFNISNLRVTGPSGGGGSVAITVDFSDPSGGASGGVNYVVNFNNLGFTSVSAIPQGVVSGGTSGTIRLDLSVGNVSRVGQVQVNLINRVGHRSNTLEGVF